MVHKTVAEALLNLIWVKVDGDISASANWMCSCPNKYPDEGHKMYIAVKELGKLCKECNIIINGGKDSLSMIAHNKEDIIKSPGTLVLTLYAACPDIYKKVTPNLKSNKSILLYIDLSEHCNTLGGTSFSRVINKCYTQPPYIRSTKKLMKTFEIIQDLIHKKLILSGHDKSDGGLITTLCEMSISSNIGIDIDIPGYLDNIYRFLFNEELGLVIEIKKNHYKFINKLFFENDIKIINIGVTNNSKNILFKQNKNNKIKVNLCKSIRSIKKHWELTSYNLEKKTM